MNVDEYTLLSEKSARDVFKDCRIEQIQEPCNKRILEIELTDSITVEKLCSEILKAFDEKLFEQLHRAFPLSSFVFKMGKDVFQIKDPNLKLDYLVNTFNTDTIFIILIHLLGAGEYSRTQGYKFYFHSHEGNRHNEPHIHVEKIGERSGTINILTLEQEEGNLNNKDLKFIRNKLKGKEKDLIKRWNLETDGIHIDLNCYLGENRIIEENNR